MNILIGGDISPVGINEKMFLQGDVNGIYSNIYNELAEADLNIINLECPLIKKHNPIKKTGPVMGVQEECIKGIVDAGIDVVGLANNHILDHDQEGVLNTLDVLNANEIKNVGAGKNLSDAQEILIIEKNDLKIGIVAMAEKEFSIASSEQAGANPIDVIQFTRQMNEHRSKLDFVIVLLHGGYQHYPYPSPELQKVSRFLVEQGANAVICQHSHCAGCLEEYKDAIIVYGQGNFIFNKPNKNDDWYEGFLIKLNIDPISRLSFELIPFYQDKDTGGVTKMENNRKDEFLNGISARSKQVSSEKFVEMKWNQFCNNHKNEYFSYLKGHNKLLRKINKKIGFANLTYSKNGLLVLSNIVRCESHREALITILNNNK